VRTYGQYCPIARGAEIFAERWTPLIIRNLHLGCETFGEILEGAPGLSRTLLTQRLEQLERLGIVELLGLRTRLRRARQTPCRPTGVKLPPAGTVPTCSRLLRCPSPAAPPRC